jgi:uncharacterized protein (TIGR02145 family)
MNIMRKIVCYVLAAFCLSSCANDDTNSGSGSATTPLSIASVSLGGLQTKSTTPAVGMVMGVFRLTGTGDYTTSQDNFSYTLGSGGWAPTVSTSKILLGPNAATLCAYLPYSASATLTSVPLVSKIDSTANDVCYKNAISASASAPAVTFDMQHALSKITFTITNSSAGTCAINNITIANAGILKNSSLNLQTGAYTNESTPTGSVLFNPAISGITSGNSATASVLMVPVTTAMSGTITLTINVDGVNKTASFNASLLPTLAAGSNYNIPVTIATAMTVGSVSTVDWSSATVSGTEYIQETANSYIIAPSGSLTIPVDVKGNGESTSAALASLSPTHTAASVGVVWQTTSGLVTLSGFDATAQTVTVTAGSASGNAVIAAYASDGTTILWSWHIWVTNYDPNTPLNGTTYSYTPTTGVTNVFMDRNLGALTATYVNDANILHYQWGRKDPFPAASVVNASGASKSVDLSTTTTQSMLWSSQNPLKFISRNSSPYDWCSTSSDYYWMGTGGTTTTPGVKTIYDPCPAGWRVPAYRSGVSPWDGLSTTGASWDSGYTWTSIGFWPAAGFRYSSSGSLNTVSSEGYYWSASPNNTSYGYYLYFTSGTMYSVIVSKRAIGISVRCVQEW